MSQAISHRLFEPGTGGWTPDDIAEPEIQRQWVQGRHELVDGVLTELAPQGFDGIDPLSSLRFFLELHVQAKKLGGKFHHEIDLLLAPNRIVRPDLVYLSREQSRRQRELQRDRPTPASGYHPIYVMPRLIIESVSVGYEDYDRVEKRNLYAAGGIPHYWILTSRHRSLVCLRLDGDSYIEESAGHGNDEIASSAFDGVSLPLSKFWDDDN